LALNGTENSACQIHDQNTFISLLLSCSAQSARDEDALLSNDDSGKRFAVGTELLLLLLLLLVVVVHR